MMNSSVQAVLRQLPSVDALLQDPEIRQALSRFPRKLVVESIRSVLERKRQSLRDHPDQADAMGLEAPQLVTDILDHLAIAGDFTLRPVINGTGIIIHTNLGRSLLPEEAIERLTVLCRSYNNLEYDLEKGQRGSRYVHAEAILCELTGAEAALVVNNNAGAVFLTLNTLAQGREVIVSRGQLVEIGGSFRIPDVMRSSGAILKEVGTTNRTHLSDYGAAIGPDTALLMKVHTSNYRILGFTSEVPLQQMVALGKEQGIPVIEDLGSGSFVDLSRFGFHGEPTVQGALAAGADLVTFSGDKLLGGPQAGVVLGRKDLVAKCKKNPLTRALRVDKMTLTALEVTLRLYRDERSSLSSIPTLRMITSPLEELEKRAENLASLIRQVDTEGRLDVRTRPGLSQVGGGSLPAYEFPSRVVSVRSATLAAHMIESSLRANKPPVIGRIDSDEYLLDVRTLQPLEELQIRDAFRLLLKPASD
jgi:L-seryl-tRNA(Ser) seleniumtransferase